ncbi:ribosome-associated translation inhibitor RaiA [Leptospira congkakensis]|uniref:Ribosome-associated translation inhibitor RaiA n=1 Tax=Leptospira congkakensis TaxID=2484932 RepID=A0A4Z1ABZ3_9LEPT|nr:ribosome-associated translation inhibitor RaiA [Leptospira congkakensis]TGL90122.1 ribosome-associated translation inhibitor RaiA [Leptospira congkakensis]TGL91129.1 ribosome-associated translation inhibitor RaiA [Leptospira congkakensis]TGL98180.1 ribosome-associated translation inhibitor RaiA [Leptospira congkakensis]
MKINYTWKHLDRSEAAEKYADEKLERVSKYVQKIVSCEVSFEAIHGEIHSNMKLLADGNNFNAHNQDKDVYVCIDGLEDKILSQTSKHHDKKSQH